MCDHFAIYTNIQSLGCVSETNIMLYANYISVFIKDASLAGLITDGDNTGAEGGCCRDPAGRASQEGEEVLMDLKVESAPGCPERWNTVWDGKGEEWEVSGFSN